MNDSRVLFNLMNRFNHYLPSNICDKIVIRVMDHDQSYPLTGSGKRNLPALIKMGLNNTIKYIDGLFYSCDICEYTNENENTSGKVKTLNKK